MGLLLLAPAIGSAQQPVRLGTCAATPDAGSDWVRYPHQGLNLYLTLPPELREVDFSSIQKADKKANIRLEQVTDADSARIVAAWDVPDKKMKDVKRVLLYAVRKSFLPTGRPCAIDLAGQPGRVFRLVLSPEGSTENEYWLQAFWPGYVLAVGGPSMATYEVGFGILKAVSGVP